MTRRRQPKTSEFVREARNRLAQAERELVTAYEALYDCMTGHGTLTLTEALRAASFARGRRDGARDHANLRRRIDREVERKMSRETTAPGRRVTTRPEPRA